MDQQTLKHILEAALLAAGQPLGLEKFQSLFMLDEQPSNEELSAALAALQEDYAARGIELVEVGSGWRLQVRQQFATWIGRLWEERPPRYSRALLETLALIAYRQPITRGEIEDIRGVSVSTTIMKTLTDREWVRVVGHRDVPGRPAMYGTTREFLDYFCLKSLDELPTLAELRDIDSLNAELDLGPEPAADEVADAETSVGPSAANDADSVTDSATDNDGAEDAMSSPEAMDAPVAETEIGADAGSDELTPQDEMTGDDADDDGEPEIAMAAAGDDGDGDAR